MNENDVLYTKMSNFEVIVKIGKVNLNEYG